MASLPARLREHAGDVTALEEHAFDESYIEFLDTQIRLSPRGPEGQHASRDDAQHC